MRPLHHLRHLLILFIGAFAGLGAKGQTYYYVDQIVVAPASPTTADAIGITLNGSLSNTASFIMNTGFTIVGSTVQLNVNAAVDGIGLDVLVPHSETFNLGMLAAGTYTIVISGTATLDMAAGPEHQFTVSGGGPTDCDSLAFLGARWGIFSDTSIVLTVANASSDLFDYPGFVLLDAEGDTIASETVSYFGIGTNPQDHVLRVRPGTLPEGSTVSGELHLWSLFYTEQECAWPVSWDLCPAQECVDVAPYLWNVGDGIVSATVPYTLEDTDGLVLSSGTYVLTPNNQGVNGQEICLPPGNYALHLEQVGIVGGQLVYGLVTPPMNAELTGSTYQQGTAENTAHIAILERCSDLANALPEGAVTHPTLLVSISGDGLVVMGTDDRPLGRLDLLDATGRLVGTAFAQRARYDWSLTGLPSGVYLVRDARHGAVRFVR